MSIRISKLEVHRICGLIIWIFFYYSQYKLYLTRVTSPYKPDIIISFYHCGQDCKREVDCEVGCRCGVSVWGLIEVALIRKIEKQVYSYRNVVLGPLVIECTALVKRWGQWLLYLAPRYLLVKATIHASEYYEATRNYFALRLRLCGCLLQPALLTSHPLPRYPANKLDSLVVMMN